jgi:hypothetical protein
VSLHLWEQAFGQHAKDRRYYGLLERTLAEGLRYHYLLLRDSNDRPCALQPFAFMEQDIVAGMSRPVRQTIASIRRFVPGFLKIKMLMVGCAAGEGDLGLFPNRNDQTKITRAVCEAFTLIARKHRRSLITFKDFPSRYRKAFSEVSLAGYASLPSFPSTALHLNFPDFDTFMETRLSKATRKDLRRKFRRVGSGPLITMEVRSDIVADAEELHALYRQVLERSEFRFEELTANYLRELGHLMPDRMRFFIWRMEDQPVAFSLCMVHESILYDMYLGLDYRVALDRHLYFVTLRDLLTWAIARNLTMYYSTPLNYDPKLRMRFQLAPLDLYVRHSSPLLNPIFRRIVPFLGPTRHDPTLAQFANYGDLAIPRIVATHTPESAAELEPATIQSQVP